MTKTIRAIIDIDVSALSNDIIENIIRNLQKDALPYMVNSFNSAAIPLSATAYAEVVTKYV